MCHSISISIQYHKIPYITINKEVVWLTKRKTRMAVTVTLVPQHYLKNYT